MNILALAATLFVGTHLLLPRTPIRGPLVRVVGEKAYSVLYSLIALATLVWMIRAFGEAPRQEVWDGAPFLWVPLVVMPIALLLMVTGLTAPNPASLGQARVLQRGEPARGVLRITRHPFNMGFALLALAHMAANGDAAALWFFGAFLTVGALGAFTQDRKKAAAHGEAWQKFAQATSVVPFAAILAGRNRLALGEFGWWRPLLALALYAGLILAHPFLFGVEVL